LRQRCCRCKRATSSAQSFLRRSATKTRHRDPCHKRYLKYVPTPLSHNCITCMSGHAAIHPLLTQNYSHAHTLSLTRTHINSHKPPPSHTHTRTYKHCLSYANYHTHTHTHTHMYTRARAHTHTFIHAHTTDIHTHLSTHTEHACTHTHTHTQTVRLIDFSECLALRSGATDGGSTALSSTKSAWRTVRAAR
jgi:hypothetical protein